MHLKMVKNIDKNMETIQSDLKVKNISEIKSFENVMYIYKTNTLSQILSLQDLV